MKKYPSVEEAEKIWKSGIEFRRNNVKMNSFNSYVEEEYIFHTKSVGECARKIAEKTPYLNPDKAYVLGLLHDYGKKYDEKENQQFHGLVGYYELKDLGYDEAAKICLTHTFPYKDFKDEEFWYPQEWKNKIREELKCVVYDDYDRLIQLCDKFPEGTSLLTIEKRMKAICERYNLDNNAYNTLIKEGQELKQYFDTICGQDVYKIIGIK